MRWKCYAWDIDESLDISDDESDNGDSEVMYAEQYLDAGSDSESDDVYSEDYAKSSEGVKYKDSNIINQESYNYSVSEEDDDRLHGKMSFKGKSMLGQKILLQKRNLKTQKMIMALMVVLHIQPGRCEQDQWELWKQIIMMNEWSIVIEKVEAAMEGNPIQKNKSTWRKS